MKLKRGSTLVIASHNKGKLREIENLITPFGIKVFSAGDLGVPEPEETGSTFEENARLKAEAAAIATGLASLSDDSGLAAEALDGAPGIYSARWAGEARDFHRAMSLVEEKLQAKGAVTAAQRRADFVCSLCLANPDGALQLFRGTVSGHLVWPPRGTQGFGYDPMFVPDGYTETFGEMDPALKHGISHRARAFAAFKAAILDANDGAG